MVSRLDWFNAHSAIGHILHGSVSAADERRRLDAYYTLDRVALEIVDALVMDPLILRVLHPACGSGAVIFALARKYLTPAGAEAAQVASELRAEREASGKGFSVTIARRELRRWLSESDEGKRVEVLVARLLG